MATTVHFVIRETVTAGAEELVAAIDVASGQLTRSFFLVYLTALGKMKVDVYAQAPTNADRTLNRVDKGGGRGKAVDIKTDAATPVQIAAGQSLLVYATNLEADDMEVLGFVNGSF